jgi:hypothetical protein
MLISKLQNEIDSFARREHFQYSEIEVEMLLISVEHNLKSIDVNLELNGLATNKELKYERSTSVEFTIDLNHPDVYFEVVKEIEQLDKEVLYRGINLRADIHIPTKEDVIMLGDGAKDCSVPSFTELFVKKNKSYYSGRIIIDFELNIDSKKPIDKDIVRKMFKDGKLEPLIVNVEWLKTIRNFD